MYFSVYLLYIAKGRAAAFIAGYIVLIPVLKSVASVIFLVAWAKDLLINLSGDNLLAANLIFYIVASMF